MESRDGRGAENAISSYEQARSALRRSHRWINLVWKHWLKYSKKGNLFQKVPPRKIAMESLEVRNLMASLPYGAFEEDTGEFFLGRVAVTPVLLESNGAIDANTENWNSGHISQVLLNLQEGLQWWKDLLATKTSVHTLDFQIDTTFATTPVPSSYEGINRVSNDYALWVTEFLNGKGFNQSSSLEQNIRAFNQAQRVKHNADWSFTVFVVNSQNEQDGTFAPGGSFSRAFAFAGGLFFVTLLLAPPRRMRTKRGTCFGLAMSTLGVGITSRNEVTTTRRISTRSTSIRSPTFSKRPALCRRGLSWRMLRPVGESRKYAGNVGLAGLGFRRRF